MYSILCGRGSNPITASCMRRGSHPITVEAAMDLLQDLGVVTAEEIERLAAPEPAAA